MAAKQRKTGVLIISYGGPRSLAEVEPFLRSVTGGRPISPALIAEFTERYRKIGGRSPLPDIAESLRGRLERALNSDNLANYSIGLAHLHSEPGILDSLALLTRGQNGEFSPFDKIIVLTLVPQYSAATVGRYIERVEEAKARLGLSAPIEYVRSYADDPSLVAAFAEGARQALADYQSDEPNEQRSVMPMLLLTAHSLPLSAIPQGDPFIVELETTARLVAESLGFDEWRLVFGSAGRSGGEWLGPSLKEALTEIASHTNRPRDEGRRTALVVPIHFLLDNLETLYDIDIELTEYARSVGIRLLRARSPNESPTLVQALANALRQA